MASFNRVVLVGNMTRDPELRTTPGGASVAEIGLAVNERRKDASGAWTEEVNFFDITVWNRSAEILRDYTRKGSSILVEGRLKMDSWEQEGQKRSKVKIVADRIVLLGSRGENGGNGGGYSQGGYQQNAGYSQGGYQNGGYQSNGYQQRQSAPRPSNQGQDYGGGDYSQDQGDDIPF